MRQAEAETRWADSCFGAAQLGDSRRTARLVRIAARLAAAPAGCISDAIRDAAERQAAYDFIESPLVAPDAIGNAAARATVFASTGEPYVFVPIDGTSLSLTDLAAQKGFGAIGSYREGGRGLKLVHSYVVSPEGVPIGTCVQRWWARPLKKPKRKACRPLRTKEAQHWVDVIKQTAELFASHQGSARPWFQIDREGDAWPMLRTLLDGGHLFTVRATWNRRLRTRPGERRTYVRDVLAASSPHFVMSVDVPEGPRRGARVARLLVRAVHVEISMKNSWAKAYYNRRIHSIQVLEVDTTPHGEKPIEWLLWTNHSIDTADDIRRVVHGYTQRWRIEELHRAWKSVCHVEDTQLRKKDHVIKWATLLLAVAARAEKLKRRMREEPDAPASAEFSATEIEAIVLLKRRIKKRTETIPDAMPTLAQAVGWIADIGGYTGKSSGGPPGAVVIARGLADVRVATETIEALRTR